MKFPLLPLESLNKESFSKIGLRSWLFRKWLGVPVVERSSVMAVDFCMISIPKKYDQNIQFRRDNR